MSFIFKQCIQYKGKKEIESWVNLLSLQKMEVCCKAERLITCLSALIILSRVFLSLSLDLKVSCYLQRVRKLGRNKGCLTLQVTNNNSSMSVIVCWANQLPCAFNESPPNHTLFILFVLLGVAHSNINVSPVQFCSPQLQELNQKYASRKSGERGIRSSVCVS